MSDIQLGNMFWREVVADRDEKIEELEKRIADLESQLSIAFEVMTDRQIRDNQHLFERSLNIEHSDSTNQTEGEN